MSGSEHALNVHDRPSTASQPGVKRAQPAGVFLRALGQDKVVLLAVIVLILVATAALFPGLIAPYDPDEGSLLLRNKPPFTTSVDGGPPYLLGTDALGHDQLSRLIYGARISIAIGLASVLVSGTIGVALGLIAGYYRGVVDDLLMRFVDLQMALPSLLLALLVLYILGSGVEKIIIVLAITRWMVYARVTRALVLTHRESVFVEAARATGCSDRRIIVRHLLPNLLSPVLVLATLEMATVILAEASLSFLGLGIQPPQSSWGLMLGQGRSYITSAWWLVTFPGLAILLTALSLNLLAGWLRLVSDPAARWRLLGGNGKDQ